MRPPRRARGLSGEDAYLWGEIARLIIPLRGRAMPGKPKPVETKPNEIKANTPPAPKAMGKPPSPVPSPKPAPPAKRIIVKPVAPAPAFPPPVALPPPPLAPGLERRVRLALRRGALQVDARIDLHGMYQAQAHDALIGFLMRARASGHTHVLVVTGKGGLGYDDAFSERGVLRRSVPHWLRASDLRGVVLGFEEAARHHGGAGALYVRLRRR
ncbi:DNA mismatch repair protein MutS [Methylobacterium sp. BTF04]|uniref:Smr/MutS family protein n=1 Tax=Methylobacterium sp. BTF04 TaxID=2708300 RepID=UPI0013CFF18D|nr:Smr/MutS family protein [Methylobacterium sp. BTF04]NEU10737.1 DNA mismatch repair protein MutS [Methylobacterium sp. BTF04]